MSSAKATTLRIGTISDTHCEFWKPRHAERWNQALRDKFADCDLLVLTGDIHIGAEGIRWAGSVFPYLPVIYVPGNHEYYRGCLVETMAAMRAEAARYGNVHLLDCQAVTLTLQGIDVRVLGATLWTDYALFGKEQQTASKILAKYRLNDFRMIRRDPSGHRPSPDDFIALHEDARRFLEEALSAPFDGVTIVATHHTPTERCTSERWRSDSLSPAFNNAMDEFVAASGAALWLCGHTHNIADFMLGDTRVVTAQFGYIRADGASETGGDGLVVELVAEER